MNPSPASTNAPRSPGLWQLAWRRLLEDRIAVVSMVVVGLFVALTVASSLNWIARNWNEEIAVGYAPPAFTGKQAVADNSPDTTAKPALTTDPYPGRVRDPLATELAELRGQSAAPHGQAAEPPMEINGIRIVDPIAKEFAEALAAADAMATAPRATSLIFGADKWGHDVLKKLIKGSETSILVGLCAALVATLIGTLLGAVSGYFGGWIDDFCNWFYSIFTAIPYLLLILTIAAVLNQKGVTTIILILGLTGWTGIFRLVRAEYIKHRSREYVQAADAIGASHARRMFVHIFPNVSHISLVQLSVHTVGFIKSEVILSFLGFGVPVDKVSWGSMLGEAQNELILGYWWQLAAATAAMALLVTAFSMFTDALRDALDPKIK